MAWLWENTAEETREDFGRTDKGVVRDMIAKIQ